MLTTANIGEHIAPYMAHLHQNRGNVWLRQMGWITLFLMSDPAPAWKSAVADRNGFSSAMGLPEFRGVMNNCRGVAEESVRHVREDQRPRVCMCMYCRLMMMDHDDEYTRMRNQDDDFATPMAPASQALAASAQLRDRVRREAGAVLATIAIDD